MTKQQLIEAIEAKKIERELLRRKSGSHFYSFCRYMLPTFYKKNRSHLKTICDTLQDLIENRLGTKKLIINIPPRHGKSLTLQLFAMWCIGRNEKTGIMTISYNDRLSKKFSKAVRDGIEATAEEDYISVFNNVFKDISIKKGDGAAQMWSVNDSHFTYLGSGMNGTITGIGCNIGIIDDPVKNADEAYNERVLEEHYDFYLNTFLSRIEEGGYQIINMTRWASDDLCGKILESESDWFVLSLAAQDDNGNMLCPELMSLETYNKKKAVMNPDIFEANYNQKTEKRKGKLYNKSFKTYDNILHLANVPAECEIDYADKGSDYLCAIIYKRYNNAMYVLDVVFTQDSVEKSHKEVAGKLIEHRVSICRIESNGGGSTFKVLLEKECNLTGNLYTVFEDFNRKGNKETRILSQSYWVLENVYMPERWQNKHNEFYKQLIGYSKEGKNLHDDACFVAGTKINTLYGKKNIEDIKINDKIITPFGIRKVLNCGITGEKPVIKNIGLEATKNHKIFIKKVGYKPLDVLTNVSRYDTMNLKGMIEWRYKKLLCSMESHTDLWGRENIILVSRKVTKEENVLKDCMLLFGNFIIKKQLKKGFAFIIKTAILLITILTIWSIFRLGNIFQNMREKILKMKSMPLKIKKHSTKIDTKQPNGIEVKRGESGILKILKTDQVSVAESGDEKTIKLNIPKYAKFAEKSLRKQNTTTQAKSRELVQLAACQNYHIQAEIKKVYNLTVEKDGVYYANNILVSNCDCLSSIAERINSPNLGGITHFYA